MYVRLSLNDHRLLHAILRLATRILWVALSAVHSRYPKGHLLHTAGQEAIDAAILFRDRLEIEADREYPDESPYSKGDAERHLPAEWPAEDVNRAIDSLLAATRRLTASPSELRPLYRAARTARVPRQKLQEAIDRGELPTIGAPPDIRVWSQDLYDWADRQRLAAERNDLSPGRKAGDPSSDRPNPTAVLPTEPTDTGPHYPVGDPRRWHEEL